MKRNGGMFNDKSVDHKESIEWNRSVMKRNGGMFNDKSVKHKESIEWNRSVMKRQPQDFLINACSVFTV